MSEEMGRGSLLVPVKPLTWWLLILTPLHVRHAMIPSSFVPHSLPKTLSSLFVFLLKKTFIIKCIT